MMYWFSLVFCCLDFLFCSYTFWVLSNLNFWNFLCWFRHLLERLRQLLKRFMLLLERFWSVWIFSLPLNRSCLDLFFKVIIRFNWLRWWLLWNDYFILILLRLRWIKVRFVRKSCNLCFIKIQNLFLLLNNR